MPIEDYALISNCRSAALISREGSIDWFCAPRFDSPACFARLLGTGENGYWRIAPQGDIRRITRRYRADSMVLETQFETQGGSVLLVDFLAMREDAVDIVRLLHGRKGAVAMRMEWVPRFDYGLLLPLLYADSSETATVAVCGADQLALRADVPCGIEGHRADAEFTVGAGECRRFHLSWTASHTPVGSPLDAEAALHETEAFWRDWLATCHLDDHARHPEQLRRSVLLLKSLTYLPTGGIVAAPTASLPEAPGGERNWDYRYCWPRDATLAIHAALSAGQRNEMDAWRHWLLRACAGVPEQIEMLYGLHGERPPSERRLDWLQGYENSIPVRIGNAAHDQLQLDVFGAVVDVFYTAEREGLPDLPASWELAGDILGHLERIWRQPDEGIWEMRGLRRHFVHSKVMCWVAFDRGIRAAEEFGIRGPVARWRKLREEIFTDVCANGFDPQMNSFTQYYGSGTVDASLLMLPIMGFLPADDARILGTVAAIERELTTGDGWLMRYRPDPELEGLPECGESAFLLCMAWLGVVYAMQGRRADAQRIHDRLLSIANDVGLLAEQYDPKRKRMLGNFPQAFSHLGLIMLEAALCHDNPPDNIPA